MLPISHASRMTTANFDHAQQGQGTAGITVI